MARYGYARVSTHSQKDDSQLDALRAARCDRIWTDKALSRMARSVKHLTEIAALLAERCIDLVVLEQGINTTTPPGRFLFHVIGAIDEMSADLISEATRHGLEAARARGRTGGRKPKLSQRQIEVARQMYNDKGEDGKREYTVAEIAETFNVSRKTIYRHLD
jgi:DNA invertase Pin-like site-specific DNA recombinase